MITSIIGGNPVLANVGSVKTDGIDISGTLHFGRVFSFYDALSFNRSTYSDNYSNGKDIVQTAGKAVPGSPEWMNKFVATATVADTEFQLIGDYVGKRYATYTNDLDVPSYFLMSLAVSANLPFPEQQLGEERPLSFERQQPGQSRRQPERGGRRGQRDLQYLPDRTTPGLPDFDG